MARAQTRKRHSRHRNFNRLVRRSGFVGTNQVSVGYQVNLEQPDELLWVLAETARIAPVTDGDSDLYARTQIAPPGIPVDGDVGARSNEFTFEDVEAASVPADIGLT